MDGTGIDYRAIEVAKQIDGWQLDTELLYLAETATRCTTALEIGSYCGRSTYAIASHLYGDEPYMTCIDDWRGEVDRPGKSGHLLFNEWTKNLKAYEFVEPFAVSSHKVLEESKLLQELLDNSEGGYDLIFIDGSHDTESVLLDCQLADELAHEKTIILGHDYFAPDVRAAVYHHYVAGLGRKVSNPAGSIWRVE